MAWNPDLYARFAGERAQPFHDLCDLIEPGPTETIRRAVDLGCGTGELTVHAARRFGVASMLGIDTSAEMLSRAACLDRSNDPEVRFDQGDLAAWTSEGDHDLVLANASLQWVPDHPGVLRRLADALAPGGWLAVQVPANADHPSHLVAADVAGTDPFLSALGGEVPPDPVAANVLAPEHYATLLHELGFHDVHVRLQVYGHVLERSADVVEWTKGTSLTRFSDRMPADLHREFVDTYREELLRRIGDRAPYFFAFKRILIRARRGAQPRG